MSYEISIGTDIETGDYTCASPGCDCGEHARGHSGLEQLRWHAAQHVAVYGHPVRIHTESQCSMLPRHPLIDY
jgi:hypothetical protein